MARRRSNPIPWGVERWEGDKVAETTSVSQAAEMIADTCAGMTKDVATLALNGWQEIRSADYCWLPVEEPDEPERPDHRDY
jgi:hypothetical protein